MGFDLAAQWTSPVSVVGVPAYLVGFPYSYFGLHLGFYRGVQVVP